MASRAAPNSAVGTTITARSFGVAQLQIVAFTPDEEVSSAKLERTLLPRWDVLFDGERFLLPAGELIPREVPRVLLQNKSADLKCEISSERIALSWHKARPDASVPPNFLGEAVRLIDQYVQSSNARVGRLAAVLVRFAPVSSPGLLLARHFCQPRWYEQPFNRPENFELHAHKVFLLAQTFRVNSWVRSKTAFATGPTGTLHGIAVEQDLNTLQEEAAKLSFANSEIAAFVAAASSEFDVILHQYYPELPS